VRQKVDQRAGQLSLAILVHFVLFKMRINSNLILQKQCSLAY